MLATIASSVRLVLVSSALVGWCWLSAGCSSRKSASPPAPPSTAPQMAAPSAACSDTRDAVACPPDPKDPSGKTLPIAGGVCALPKCKPCGSATAPAYRDYAGVARKGWCLCVPQSDDSPRATFTCFTLEEWSARGGR